MLVSYHEKVKSLGFPEGWQAQRKFLTDLTFEESLSLIDSEGFRDLGLSQESKLSYWIFRAIKNGQDNIRILSSFDDVINPREFALNRLLRSFFATRKQYFSISLYQALFKL